MFFSEERVATNKFQNANLSSRIKSSFVVKESGSILFYLGFFLRFISPAKLQVVPKTAVCLELYK